VNLLDNAVKFGPPTQTVQVRLSAGMITVADEGCGITDEDRPHVFDRFYRAAASRALPGSGLGLAIVARAAELHGARVSIERRNPEGTTVTIAFTSHLRHGGLIPDDAAKATASAGHRSPSHVR
jgi:two-component system sensor histidine kinase MprB